MDMTDAASKQCVLCGQDRTGRPRVKDPKGRYFCPDCYERARQRKQQAVEAAPSNVPLATDAAEETSEETAVDEAVDALVNEDSSLLDELVSEIAPPGPTQQMEPCRNCGEPTPVGHVICTSCGYNRQTGAILSIKAPKRRVDWASDSGMFLTPGVAGGAMMAVFGIQFFIGRTVEPVAVSFLFTYWLFSLGVTLAVLWFAFRTSIGHGLATLLVPFYMIWFVYGIHEGPYLKWLYGAMLVGGALFIALVTIVGFDAGLEQIWSRPVHP